MKRSMAADGRPEPCRRGCRSAVHAAAWATAAPAQAMQPRPMAAGFVVSWIIRFECSVKHPYTVPHGIHQCSQCRLVHHRRPRRRRLLPRRSAPIGWPAGIAPQRPTSPPPLPPPLPCCWTAWRRASRCTSHTCTHAVARNHARRSDWLARVHVLLRLPTATCSIIHWKHGQRPCG